MYKIIIRYYEELNDFLPKENRKKDIDFSFTGRRSVKDLIESMGVPHVEVDLILVNGESVDFNYIIRDGDRISVYPVFERISIENATRLRERPLRDLRFVLDVHLTKLARRLRLLGFDVIYHKQMDDQELAEISSKQNRILLTRDRQLLKRKIVTKGLAVRNTDPVKQVFEIIDRLDLKSFCRPFSRCIECNGKIEKLFMDSNEFDIVKYKIPEGVLSWCSEYFSCVDCGRIYWKGSHYEKLKRYIMDIIKNI